MAEHRASSTRISTRRRCPRSARSRSRTSSPSPPTRSGSCVPVEGLAVIAEGRHAARARWRRRGSHALRRQRAGHADAAPEEGRDRGAHRAIRQLNVAAWLRGRNSPRVALRARRGITRAGGSRLDEVGAHRRVPCRDRGLRSGAQCGTLRRRQAGRSSRPASSVARAPPLPAPAHRPRALPVPPRRAPARGDPPATRPSSPSAPRTPSRPRTRPSAVTNFWPDA